MLDSKKFVITLVAMVLVFTLAALGKITGASAAWTLAAAAGLHAIGQGIADGWSGGSTSGVANRALDELKPPPANDGEVQS